MGLNQGKGVDNDSEEYVHILVLAATNRPEILDPALLRPGRFDRIVEVGVPDCDGRKKVLLLHSEAVRCDPQLDWDKVAKTQTIGMTGADLANIINEGALIALRRGGEIVTENDILLAASRNRKDYLNNVQTQHER